METSAFETHSDLPSFVPEKDLRAALTAAQNMARQRDELAAEIARLRRDLEASARSQRELEEATRGGGDGLSRRLRLLREALAKKDQEILNLRTFTAGHSKQLKEAREAAERLRRERGELEERLRSREGAFTAIERERENLSRALDGARRDGELAARVVVQADTAVNEWRAALAARDRELDEARRQLGELRAAWQSVAQERQRLVEAHAAELATVRAEADAALAQLREETRGALAEAGSRFDAAREAHAIALRAAEDEHASVLAEERAARERVEESLVEARARAAQAESARNWADGELAAMRARLESAEAGAESIGRELQEEFARELEAARKAHEAERRNLGAAYESELKAARQSATAEAVRQLQEDLRALGDAFAEAEGSARAHAADAEEHKARLAKAEAALADAARRREEAEARAATAGQRHEGALRELAERHEDALREAEGRYRAALDEARSYFSDALEAQRESHEAEVLELNDNLSGDEARVRDLERALDAAREALGDYAAESALRLQSAEHAAEEAAAARDRYARKYAAAMQELRRLRDGGPPAAPATPELPPEAFTRLVAEVMTRAVEAVALEAARRTRAPPALEHVEEAIGRVTEGLPESLRELLWGVRDALLARCRAAAA